MTRKTTLSIFAAFLALSMSMGCVSNAFSQSQTPSIQQLEAQLKRKLPSGTQRAARQMRYSDSQESDADNSHHGIYRVTCSWHDVSSRELILESALDRIRPGEEIDARSTNRTVETNTLDRLDGRCQQANEGEMRFSWKFGMARDGARYFHEYTIGSRCLSGDCRDNFGPADKDIGHEMSGTYDVLDGGQEIILHYDTASGGDNIVYTLRQ